MEDADYYACYQLYEDLQQYCFANSFIENIYVLFEQDDMVVGNDGIITSQQYFYCIRYDLGVEEYQHWLSQQWDWPNYSGNLYSDDVRIQFGDREPMLHYVWLVTSGVGERQRSARILIYIEESRLRPLIAGQLTGMTHFAIHMNGNENTISLGRPEDTMSESQKLLTFTKDVPSGRQYLCTIQKDSLFQEWYSQLLVSVIFLVLACLIGGWLAFFLAKRNSAPILNMVRLVDGDGKAHRPNGQNVLDYLQGSVSDILKDRKQFQDELERRLPMLQATFMERLLSGSLPDYSDLDGQMQNIGLSLKGAYYCVAVFQLNAAGEEDSESRRPFSAARIAAEHVIYTCAGQNIYLYSMENDRITVILPLEPEETMDNVQQLCSHIVRETARLHNIRLQAALGRSYPELADVFLSLMQARKALDSGQPGDVVFYTPASSQSSYFYYPPEMEQSYCG